MASRREEKERLRQARLEAERRESEAERRRLILGYVVAGLLTAAVVAGLVIVIASGGGEDGPTQGDFPEHSHIQPISGATNDVEVDAREGTPPPAVEQGDLERAAGEAGCELRLDLPDEGNTHLQPSDPVPDYDTNPPTSGDHIVSPLQQADGAYREMPDPRYTVHSLEHGRINIQYDPALPERDQLELKGVFEEDPNAVLFFPNPEMPYAVAVTAWARMLTCDRYEGRATLDAIRAFRDTLRGQGPEDVPIVLG
jgi:hypothetical protein